MKLSHRWNLLRKTNDWHTEIISLISRIFNRLSWIFEDHIRCCPCCFFFSFLDSSLIVVVNGCPSIPFWCIAVVHVIYFSLHSISIVSRALCAPLVLCACRCFLLERMFLKRQCNDTHQTYVRTHKDETIARKDPYESTMTRVTHDKTSCPLACELLLITSFGQQQSIDTLALIRCECLRRSADRCWSAHVELSYITRCVGFKAIVLLLNSNIVVVVVRHRSISSKNNKHCFFY
jgi:hypothetical protein